MENVYLDCLIRGEIGKNKVNSLRRSGFIPAVVYGQGKDPLAIKLNRSQLVKFIHSHRGIENMVITLRVSEGDKDKSLKDEKAVLIKEIQLDPVREDILHIDFNQISLTKAIAVKIPIEPKGEAIGVKQEGGVLTRVLWELEIECLPTKIPEKIIVDVSNMKMGDVIYVKDISIPGDVKLLVDKEAIVFTVTHPKKEEVAVEAPTEGAVPVEPEVIKEKKEKAEKGDKEEEATAKEAPKTAKEPPKKG